MTPRLFVPRAAWGAVQPRKVTRLDGASGVAGHWNGPSLPLPDHMRCAHAVRGIQYFHMASRGWADVAYSALVCPHGSVYEGRGPNVRTAANGTDDGNDRFYAVCYLGGEGDPFTAEAKQAFRDARLWLMSVGNAGPKVVPHSGIRDTACPGDVIRAWLPTLAAAPEPTPPAPSTVEVTLPHLPVLSLGASGKWAKKLQGLLVAHGVLRPADLDGVFGPRTRAALVRHQDAHGLPADGTTTEPTWLSLIAK